MNTLTDTPNVSTVIVGHHAACCEEPTLRPTSPLMVDVFEFDPYPGDIIDAVLVFRSRPPRKPRRVGSIVW